MSSFVQRLIDVTFTLGSGSFSGGGGNQEKLSGLRVKAKIVKAGGPAMGTAVLEVYGMTLSMMNQLSTLGMQVILIPRNVVTVEAGDAESGMAIVFQGTITGAWSDFDSAPNVSFHVEAHTGLIEAVLPASPTSYAGSVDAATVFASLASQMGRAFENNGVVGKLSNPYWSGSARVQAYAAARAFGCNINLDDPTKLIVWPRGKARDGQASIVSPSTGMIGYPSWTAQGVVVKTLFNPSIGFGGKIIIQDSVVTPANGEWAVYMLDHDLESREPGGTWQTRVQGYNPNFPAPVIQ